MHTEYELISYWNYYWQINTKYARYSTNKKKIQLSRLALGYISDEQCAPECETDNLYLVLTLGIYGASPPDTPKPAW
jgi:hypothetical protein